MPEVFVVDGDLEASVETAGGITVTKHPTLTRMAAGAILPGSALIPGLAFQKTETHDYRELYFVIEHPEWAAMAQVNPGSWATVRAIALALNRLARSIAARDRRSGNISQPENPVAVDRTVVLEQLGKLGELLGAGVLSEEEFREEKAKIPGGAQTLAAGDGQASVYRSVSLIPDGPTVDVVFPDRLSFDPDDLSALAETRAECVRWIESAQSDIDKAAAILATFNVVVLLCSAGEELRGSADSKFRSRADQSAFVGWLEAIEEEQRELSTRCDDAFNALSRADAEAAVLPSRHGGFP